MKYAPSFSVKISSFFCFLVTVVSYFIEFIAFMPCIEFDGVACLIIPIKNSSNGRTENSKENDWKKWSNTE